MDSKDILGHITKTKASWSSIYGNAGCEPDERVSDTYCFYNNLKQGHDWNYWNSQKKIFQIFHEVG